MDPLQSAQSSERQSLSKNNDVSISERVEDVSQNSKLVSLREMRNSGSKRHLMDGTRTPQKSGQSRFSKNPAPNKSAIEQKKEGVFVNRINVLKKIMLFKTRIFENAHLLPKDKSVQHKISKERFLMACQGQKIESDQQISASLAIPVFQANNLIVQLLDYLSIIMTFLSMWIYPFIISFPKQRDGLQSTYITIAVHSALDILFQSNKAIIDQGVLICNRRQIIKFYFQDQGISDCFLLLIWILNSFNFDNFFLQSTFTLIYLILNSKRNFSRISNVIEASDFKGSQKDLMDLGILITIIYFFAHTTACFWHYIAQNSFYLGNSWIISYELENQSDSILYNYAFYWAIETMTTVGYGDVIAKNYFEILFSNILMLLSSCLFGYSMNQIGVIVKNINESTSQYKRSLLIINSYMKNHQVSFQVQGRVRNYLKYYLQADSISGNIQNVNEIVQKMPQSIQQDLNEDIKIKIINKITFLDENFSLEVKQAVAQIMEFVQFTPQELIYKQNEETDYFLNYITEGQVNIIEVQSERVLEIHEKGATIGQLEFITNQSPRCTAISKQFTSIFRINRVDFIKILKKFPKDYEKFMDIKDTVGILANYKLLKIKCQICLKQHQTILCPLINYLPDLEKIVLRQNFMTNKRKQLNRREFRVNSRGEFQVNKTCSTAFWKDYSEQEQSLNLIQSSQSFTDEEFSIPTLQAVQKIPETKKHQNIEVIAVLPVYNSIRSLTKKCDQGLSSDAQIKPQKSRRSYVIQATKKVSENRIHLPPDQIEEICFDQVFNYFYYQPQNNLSALIIKKSYTSTEKERRMIKHLSQYMFSFILKYIILRTKQITT